MQAITYSEWQTGHLENNYPFASEELPLSIKSIPLPHGIVIDACIARYGTNPVWLSRIAISPTAILIVFTTYDENTRKVEISGTSNLENLPGQTMSLAMDGRVCGRIVFGRNALGSIAQIPQGVHFFQEAKYQLEASCVMSLGTHQVSGIRIGQTNLRGKIALVEGDGVRITATPTPTGYNLKFDAIGKALDESCCPEDYDPIETIGSITPDTLGNVKIVPKQYPEPSTNLEDRQLLRVVPVDDGIKIELAR